MKKSLIGILFCIFVFISVFAEEAESKAKEFTDINANIKTYKFDGFQFNNYKPSTLGLEDIIRAEYDFIKSDYSGEKFAIVGHSQGGLRVLGFTNYIEKKDPDMLKNLNAVITVSGIDRGLKALEGGLPVTNAKIKRDLQVISSAVIGTIAAIPCNNIFLNSGQVLGLMTENKIFNTAWDYVNKNLPNSGIMAWLKPCLGVNSKSEADTVLNNMGEIRDMIPRSEFIEKNVMESTPYTYKVQTGSSRRLGWKKVTNRWGWRYWAIRWIYTPIYSYYTAYNYKSQLPAEVPIGYIVGLKNNTLDMLPKGKTIRDSFKDAGKWMDKARKVHIVHSCFIWGLFTGCPRYARQCRIGRDYCYNIDSNINKLLGSNENDGLVAKESQYIPQELHQKYISIDNKLYITFDYNHKEIFYYKNTKEPPQDVKDKIKKMIELGGIIRN